MVLHQFETPDAGVVARATGNGRFQTRLDLRGGPIMADEPLEVGGLATGPTPYELLAAALAACTSMTIRLYAERKQWALPPFSVAVAHSLDPGNPPRDVFARHIAFEAALEYDRQARLIEIADRCPVHRTLAHGFEVRTSVDSGAAIPSVSSDRHVQDMETACED